MFVKVLQGDLDPSARSLLQPEKIWGPLVSNISGGQEQGHSDQIGNMPKNGRETNAAFGWFIFSNKRKQHLAMITQQTTTNMYQGQSKI